MSAAESLGSEARSRYLPSRFSSAFALDASVRSRPPGVTRRYRFRPGFVEMTPRSSGRLSLARAVRPVDELFQLGGHAGADRGVPLGSRGAADDEPLVLGDPDLLDPEVLRDLLVAALPRQSGGRLGRAGADPLADDVVVAALAARSKICFSSCPWIPSSQSIVR